MASKLRWALAAAVLPVFSFAITEAEVAASARAYFAPMTSANFWRMRMPDGLIREFELRESGNGKFRFQSADGWTGVPSGDNGILITTPRNQKPKVEWGFQNGTLRMIAEDGNAYGLDYSEPVVYEGESMVRLWPDRKDVRGKDIGPDNWVKSRRLKLGYTSPNRAGVVLAMLALVALGLAFRMPRLWARIVCGVLCAGALVPMTLTGSRGALLAFVVGAAAIGVCELKRSKVSRRTVFAIGGTFLLVVALIGVLMCSGVIRSKKGNRSSDRQRTLLMETAPRMLRDAPKGWGHFGAVGGAYVSWYQDEKDEKLRLNLVSDHITAVVGRGWVGGGVYLFCWFAGILLLLAFAWRGGSPIPVAVWLALGSAAFFNLIFGEKSVFVIPLLSLLFFLWGRPWRMPWMFLWCPLAGLVLSAATIFCVITAAGDGSADHPRIRKVGRRVLVNGECPVRWVVDDLQVLGQVMAGKDVRAHFRKYRKAPAIGYVRSIRDLPTDGSVRHLVLAGDACGAYLKMLKEKGYPEKMPLSVLFLSPQFPPSEIPAELHARTRQVTMVVGEFAARYSREFLDQKPWVRIVPGAELYIPNWMRFVAVK